MDRNLLLLYALDGFFFGVIVALVFWSAWSWWATVSPGVSWAAFWRPVRDLSLHGKPWLKVHLVAHLIGGAAAAAALLFLRVQTVAGMELTDAWWKRFLLLLIVQALWERIQHENWKQGDGSSDYPWWSAVWDVQITLAGWGGTELAALLVKGWIR